MTRLVLFVATASLLSALASAGTPAQDAADQLRQGQAIYVTKCASCHGAKMTGGAGPALRPVSKTKVLKLEASAADFAKYVKLNMPVSDPGSMTTAQSLSVVAFILKQDSVMAADTPLTAAAAAVLKVKRGHR